MCALHTVLGTKYTGKPKRLKTLILLLIAEGFLCYAVEYYDISEQKRSGGVNRYEELVVWQKSHKLALSVYEETKLYPKEERYVLVDQIRRCSISIPSNIAEGAGHSYKKNFARFLEIAKGSSFELDYQLRLSRDLGYIKEDKYKELRDEVKSIQKMLFKLIESLRR